MEKKEIENFNDYFDKYCEQLGNIYDIINLHNSSNIDNTVKTLKEKQKFNEINFKYDLLDISNFNKFITLNQFKTWFDLIICKIINKKR